jgi:hypothetical protein
MAENCKVQIKLKPECYLRVTSIKNTTKRAMFLTEAIEKAFNELDRKSAYALGIDLTTPLSKLKYQVIAKKGRNTKQRQHPWE